MNPHLPRAPCPLELRGEPAFVGFRVMPTSIPPRNVTFLSQAENDTPCQHQARGGCICDPRQRRWLGVKVWVAGPIALGG